MFIQRFSGHDDRHGRRADINDNGRFDPEPPPPQPNEPQMPVWPGSDGQIFVREYVRTFLAYQGTDEGEFIGDGELAALHREALSPPAQPERLLRAIGILSQPQVESEALGVHIRFGEPRPGPISSRNQGASDTQPMAPTSTWPANGVRVTTVWVLFGYPGPACPCLDECLLLSLEAGACPACKQSGSRRFSTFLCVSPTRCLCPSGHVRGWKFWLETGLGRGRQS